MEGLQGRLAWRCRRGMKELDLILQDWLARDYPRASPAERLLFAQFLELPDPELARYLLGHDTPSDPAIAALVAQLATPRH
jgi:antitoxin CptB